MLGIIKALSELQLNVPGDVSVVGFDDFPESMLVRPFFTAAVQPAYEMGRLAAEILLKRITGELPEEFQKKILPTEIIERESTGPMRKSSA
jgi:LacI family transcriptional regulator